METSNRRKFLKLGAGTAGLFIFSQSGMKAIASSCGITPPQTPGPFYPGESQFHRDSDLTLIAGSTKKALGQIVYIRGKVTDQNCRPVKDAMVEVWQACASGKYNNAKDPNPAPLDPNFKYWGEVPTDAQGEYMFKTIRPGAYPADTDWIRPPHIHFKITRLGYKDLVTQMYFKGDPLNDQDLIFKQIPDREKGAVLVDFQSSPVGFEPDSLLGVFDITIRSVRA